MDYKEQAKDLLSRKNSLMSAYSAIKSELSQLEEARVSCQTSLTNAEKLGRNADIYEEHLISLLADMEDCRFRKSIVERELSKIEKGLNGLTEYQKDLINTFFVEKTLGGAEDIMLRWRRERSTVYRDRVRVLEDFTRSVYGVLQF